MIISGVFEIEYNRPEVLQQEYRLARQEYDEALSLPIFRPACVERFRAARARLNRARGMLVYA